VLDNTKEIPLTGGRITQNVTRKGDVVYRPCCSNSGFVHRVLQWLENAGIEAAPRLLGIADDGREMTTFLEGTSPADLGFFNDTQLIAAAKIIRTLHDALSDFPGCKPGQTVCHNDLSPCNIMFDGDIPYAVFDWDAAAIGDPLDDIAYAIWMWCDIGHTLESDGPDIVGQRIRTFLEAYGLEHEKWSLLLNSMCQQMQRVSDSLGASGNTEGQHWAADCARILKVYEDELMSAILK